ncbi:hypothetical protein ACQKWADRAFT_286418 [Trichoderma austrokoningii]
MHLIWDSCAPIISYLSLNRVVLLINLPVRAVTFLAVFYPADPDHKSKGTLKGFLD